jgi:hypothetical protein
MYSFTVPALPGIASAWWQFGNPVEVNKKCAATIPLHM